MRLHTEADGRMFPTTNDSQTIVDCLAHAATEGDLVENDDEQEVIKLVAKYKAKGLSLRKIAAVLDRAGHRSRTGKPLSAMSVSRMAA